MRRRGFENRCEGQRLRKVLRYENTLWSTGLVRVAGVDKATGAVFRFARFRLSSASRA